MSTPTMKSFVLLSTMLLASAQLSTIPRRLRRGAIAKEQELKQYDFVGDEEEFGRARDLEGLSFSMSVSMSVDLTQSGMDFLPVIFDDDTASMESTEDNDTSDPTKVPSYWPTYYPTAEPTDNPIGTQPTAPPEPTESPSYYPTYYPTAEPSGPTPVPVPTSEPSYYPTYYPTAEPSGPTPVPVPTSEPSYYPTYYPTAEPSGPTPVPVPTSEPSYYPTYYPTAGSMEGGESTAPTYVFATPEPTTAKAQSDMQPLTTSEESIICKLDRECPGETVCNCGFLCKFCFLQPCGVCGPEP